MGSIGLVLVVPLLWVGFEYLRGALFTGFPWNPLGVSQFRNLIIIQAAEWGGVYAVSGVLVVFNTVLTITSLRLIGAFSSNRRLIMRLDLGVAVIVFAVCWIGGMNAFRKAGMDAPDTQQVRLAAIQPNIPQLKKWPLEFAQEIYSRLRSQTEVAVMAQPDLIVWPETCVPGPLTTDPETMRFVESLATNNIPLLVGALEEGAISKWDITVYNSSFLFDGHGAIADVYRKLHLVPFGEYLPFDSKVAFIKRLAPLGFSCTPGTDTTIFHLAKPDTKFAVLICFEDIFAPLSRIAVRKGARFLINQTNDAWFDGSSGALQHLSQCVFRCVENRVGAVRVANTGVTCFIDRSGRTTMLLDATGNARFLGFKLDGLRVSGPDMPLTFYTRYGDIPFALPCGVAAAVVFALVLIHEKRKMKTTELKEATV
jgi:apolipoprotein N-acyltransferase